MTITDVSNAIQQLTLVVSELTALLVAITFLTVTAVGKWKKVAAALGFKKAHELNLLAEGV